MPDPSIPAVYLVFNGPLEMSPGKMAAQAFQVCQRLFATADGLPFGSERAERRGGLAIWERHTTTIARVAKTPTMFERVCAELEGVVMVDEGYTEVEAGSATVWASWPLFLADVPGLLSNKKIPLL